MDYIVGNFPSKLLLPELVSFGSFLWVHVSRYKRFDGIRKTNKSVRKQ